MRADLKRVNFNVNPDQEAELEMLRSILGVSTMKDAILQAGRIVRTLRKELAGSRLFAIDDKGEKARILIPELEEPASEWQYLGPRLYGSKEQLGFKGRKLYASIVVEAMNANQMSVAETAKDWDLPEAAVQEAIRYVDANADLIQREWEEDRRKGIEAGLLKDENPD